MQEKEPHLAIRPATAVIPAQPGVYRFLDAHQRVIYVGKAKNLRNRLVNYFQSLDQLHPRTRKMVLTARDVKWVVVDNELSALSLEYAWIKEYNPRFNVMYRDDKSYPYLALSFNEPFARLYITRERKRAGTRYFGPYTQVWAVRKTIELIRCVFALRDCSTGVFRSAQAARRPCLQGYIGKCCAPCVGRVSQQEYRALAQQVADFLDGKSDDLLAKRRAAMEQAAEQLDFETAAQLRDQVQALETMLENNVVVYDEHLDADVFGLAIDELGAYAQIFYVRAGRIRAEKGFMVDFADPESSEQLYATLLEQSYGRYASAAEVAGKVPDTPSAGTDTPSAGKSIAAKRSKAVGCTEAPTSVDDVQHTSLDAIPREIILYASPADLLTLQQWLTQLRGAPVRLNVPQRGKKKALAQLAYDNAVRAQKRPASDRFQT